LRSWEVVGGLGDVITATQPQRFAERILSLVRTELHVLRSAMFVREQDRVRLFCSRGTDQPVLDFVAYAWSRRREALENGEVVTFTEDTTGPPEARAALVGGATAAYVVPMRIGESLEGLLYVDCPAPLKKGQLKAIVQLARLATPAITGALRHSPTVASYLEETTIDEVMRDQLLLMFERHEWNISRVARALGVTRRTIYLRIGRLGIKRQHVRKTPAKRHAT
jgi:transcriptional regulator with GAF, ATPase, and Fis domain